MNNNEIRFYRKKTETTRKKNVKQIIVPRTPGGVGLLKLGDKNSLLFWASSRRLFGRNH
ncbi:MAG: hypothetical protein U5L72_13460 [Bacteroidales bacterium]|nr:hypothetical protein [Bacteroidales bacterium]